MGNLFTEEVGKLLTRLLGNYLTEALEKYLTFTDKHLAISLHPNDVLCATSAEMEAKLRFIADSCCGRRHSVRTSGLTPLSDDVEEYIRVIRTWTCVAQRIIIGEVYGGTGQKVQASEM